MAGEGRRGHRREVEQLLRQRTEELARAKERLLMASRVKGEFLAHMSRELRTPLHLIIDSTAMLLYGSHGHLSPEQERVLRLMQESGNRLLGGIDRILTLADLEVGVTRFLSTRVNPRDLVSESLERIAPLATAQGVHLSLEVVGEPSAIDADGAKLSFMLEELLTNAVKFSPPGGQVSCRMREVTVDGRGLRHYLELSVSDQGRGIAPEDHDRIFKVFERTTPSETANGSLGLGLPLVKRFVDLHGGRIWLSSAPGEGSTFTILIPYGGVSHVERENPRIILCDPDDNFAAMVSHYLGEEGWSVQRLSDGFALLQQETPADLFLIALDSPGVGGIDLCLRLKADLATLHVPVLLLAAQGGEGERPKAFQVGCDGFFVKPVEFEELVPVVRTLVRRKMEFEFLKKSCEAAELQACTDALTGLCNLRQLMVVLERELERSRRYGRECSLAMIDIDWFKHYNDSYGHLAGDEILVAAASLFRGDIRNSDLAARYGGEEFVVLMPETGKPLAGRVGEKLRQVFEGFPFPHEESQPGGRLTISMGIATFPADAATSRELLDRADQALYEAKRRGRNCLVLWGE